MSGKDLWVEALRSKSYTQGYSRLKSGNKFCAIGVLADVYAQKFPELASWDSSGQLCFNTTIRPRPVRRTDMEGNTYYTQKPPFHSTQHWKLDVPLSIAEWGGLILHEPATSVHTSDTYNRKTLPFQGRSLHVEYLNDIQKLDFSLLGDLIEAYL